MMKNHLEDLPSSVAEMAEISLTGNIVPISWFQKLTFDNGKPDLNSILILADICYWYKPAVLRDERTGAVIGQKKKFAEDLLRKSYSDLQAQFGLSDRQLRDCFSRLENRGVIRRVFRTKNSSNGRQGNVMYIELFPSVVKELTHGNSSKPLTKTVSDPINMDSPPYHDKTGEGVTSNGIPITIERDTYHDITGAYIETKNTTETTSSLSSGDPRVESFFSPKKDERDEKNSISEKMLEIWSKTLPTKTPSIISKQLRTNLEKALKEQLQGNLKNWQVVCETFSGSKFLMSEAVGVSFKPSLGWLVSPQKDFVSRVFAKEGWTFDDRKTETKTPDFEATESAIEALDEPKLSKEVRLFIFQNNPGFYKSYVEKTVICQKGEEVLILSSSGLSRDKIQEQCYDAVADFLKQRYQLGLVIKTKEEEASHALKE